MSATARARAIPTRRRSQHGGGMCTVHTDPLRALCTPRPLRYPCRSARRRSARSAVKFAHSGRPARRRRMSSSTLPGRPEAGNSRAQNGPNRHMAALNRGCFMPPLGRRCCIVRIKHACYASLTARWSHVLRPPLPVPKESHPPEVLYGCSEQ